MVKDMLINDLNKFNLNSREFINKIIFMIANKNVKT